jgi:predicted kinase
MSSDPPLLIAIFGLPGTGKTTVAELLAQHLGTKHFNTDKIRDRIDKREQYDEENKDLVYDKMLELTKSEIEKGKNVIVDGTFYKKKLRMRFMELANSYDASMKWVEVCAKEETVKKRVSKTRRYSEADYAVYQKIKTEFEPMEEFHIQLFSDVEEYSDMVKKAMKFIKR